MEITEQEFQELLKTGDYPLAVDEASKAGIRWQHYVAPKPTNAGHIIVMTFEDGSRSISVQE